MIRDQSGSYDALAFSPDGAILAGSNDGNLQFWRVADGKLLHTFAGFYSRIDTLVFSPDGGLVAASGKNGLCLVWDVANGRIRHRFTNFKMEVSAVAFSPDGTRLVAGGYDLAVAVYNLSDGTIIRRLPFDGAPESIAFDPTGRRVAIGGRFVESFDLASGAAISKFGNLGAFIRDLAYTPDGRFLISGASDMGVTVWDAESGKQVALLRDYHHGVASLALSRDGAVLITGSWDAAILVWDLAPALAAPPPASPSSPPLRAGPARSARLTAAESPGDMALSPDGRFVASIVHGNVLLTATADGGERTLGFPARSISTVAFSADGNVLAGSDASGQIAIWDTASGALRRTIKAEAEGVRFLALNAAGTLLATNGKDEGGNRPTVQLWETASGRATALLRPQGTVGHFSVGAFSADGRYLAVGDIANLVLLFDLASG